MTENSDGPLGDEEIVNPEEEAQEGEGAPPPASSAAELQKKNEQLRAMLEDSTSRAAQTQERLKDIHERLLRTAAEFDNYRKRAQKEKEDSRKFAVESLLKDFLPVADNLERALDHAEEHDLRQVIDGVRLVQKMLADALAKHGIAGFSAVGQPFDPNLHEALMQEESDRAPLYPCPVCLRKLCWNLRVEPGAHLRRLADFCTGHGLEDGAWFARAAQVVAR